MLSEFLSENIYLVAALVVVANLLILSMLQGSVKGAANVSALELPQLQRNGDSTIIDLSDAKDFSRAHIPDSINMTLEDLNADNKKLSKMQGSPCIVVCQTGGKSVKGARALVSLGFSDVHILTGGLMSWTKENLPTASQ